MRKGENAGYQYFLLFPKCFQKTSFLRVVKSRDCVVKKLNVIDYHYQVSLFIQLVREFQERKEHLKKRCDIIKKKTATERKPRYKLQKMNYIEDKNIFFCPIEKAASTFWQRVLYIASVASGHQSTKLNDVFSVNPLQAYTNKNQHRFTKDDNVTDIIKHSNSFIFVRDPFTRLFSGWLDKFFSPNPYYHKKVGRLIIRGERPQASQDSLRCGHDVTFQEYVSFISKAILNGENVDRHFLPSYSHCDVCSMDFKYIGKYENLAEEYIFMLQQLAINDNVAVPPNFAEESALDMINDAAEWVFYIKRNLTLCMQFHVALFRVWKRLISRGVISKRMMYPYTSPIKAYGLTRDSFQKVLIDAHKRSNPEELSKNREEVLSEAFHSLDNVTFKRMLEAFNEDFDLFNYSKYPTFMALKPAENDEKYLLPYPPSVPKG